MNTSRYIALFILLVLLVGIANAATVVVEAIGNASDGSMRNTSTNLYISQIRLGDGTNFTNTGSITGNLIVAGSTSQRYAVIARYGWCGNASASGLPANATITNATFSVSPDKWTSTIGLGNISSGLINFNPTNPLLLAASDFNKTNFIRYSDAANDKKQNSTWDTENWNTWVLNVNATTNISKTGTTCLMMAWKGDIENSTSELSWSSGAYSTQKIYDYGYSSTNRANITITYDMPAGANASFTTNATANMTPTRGILFTDTSTGISGIQGRLWRYKDYGSSTEPVFNMDGTGSSHTKRWNIFNTTSNQTSLSYTFGAGNWSIELDVRNASGWYNTTPNSTWLNISAGIAGSTRLPGSYQFNPADAIWYQNVTTMPIHPSNATWITRMKAMSPTDIVSTFTEGSQGVYVLVNSTISKQPLVSTSNGSYVDSGYFPPTFNGYPIPDDLVSSPTAGSDRGIELIDTTNKIVYTMSNTQKRDNGQWQATGTIWNYTAYCYRYSAFANGTDNNCKWLSNKWVNVSGLPRMESAIAYYPTDAGLPFYPTILRYEEVATGNISHMLFATVHMAGFTSSPVYPAVGVGQAIPNAHCTDGQCPPVGAIMRLKASKNISGFGTQSKTIAQALKTHGAVVTNDGTDNIINFFGVADSNWNTSDINAGIKSLTVDDFEFIDISSLKINNYTMQSNVILPTSASFTADVTSGTTPLTVGFTDTSTNSPTAWSWSFQNVTPGNNTQIWWSTSQNPVKIFTAGNYKIVLNASNSTGFNITPSNFWVNVSAVPSGNYTTTTQRFYAPATAADGRINNDTSSTYAVKRASQGNLMVSTSTTIINLAAISFTSPPVNTSNALVRFFVSYDTSGIPDNAIIQSASVGYVGDEYSPSAAGNVSCGITGFSPQNPSSLAVTDYNRFLNQTYSSDYINISRWNAGERTFSLNSYGRDAINKTGLTPVALRLKDDILGTDSEFVYVSSGYSAFRGYDTSAGGSLRPFIDVTYSYESEPSVVSFTSNVSTPVTPGTGVLFTDTSSITGKSGWTWAYKDYSGHTTDGWTITPNATWNNFSTSQNPSYSWGAGNWSIRLTVTNGTSTAYISSDFYKWINVSSGARAGEYTLPSNYLAYPDDAIWNVPKDTLPVDSNSAMWINGIAKTADTYTGWYYMYSDSGIPHIAINGSSIAKQRLTVDVPGTNYFDSNHLFPIPDNMTVEEDDDHHVTLIDPVNRINYELYQAEKNANGTWTGSATIWNTSDYKYRVGTWLDYNYYSQYPNPANPSGTLRINTSPQWASSMSGVSQSALMVRYSDIEAGKINHSLFLTIPSANGTTIFPSIGSGFWHNTTSVGRTQGAPPAGALIRLKSSYDISGLTPQAKVIAQALKTYGGYVLDNNCGYDPQCGRSFHVGGFTDPRWSNADLANLGINISNFEFVNAESLIINNTTGTNCFDADISGYHVCYSMKANVTTTAGFTANVTSGSTVVSPASVQFNDTSTYIPDSYQWNATDVTGTGVPFTFSIAKNPAYTFTAGNYSIKLTATKPAGSNITPGMYFINVSSSGGVIPSANFTGIPLNISTGQSVQFTDTSTGSPTSWKWCFGDLSQCNVYSPDSHAIQSMDRNPSHNFYSTGIYTVTMMATNALGSNVVSKVNYINVTPVPVLVTTNFNPRGIYTVIDPECSHMGYACTYEYRLSVQGGSSVAYESTTTNADTLAWTGTNESGTYYGSNNNFTMKYSNAGTYTITLQGTNSYNTSIATTKVYSSEPPVTPIPVIYGSVTNMPVAHATSPATYGNGSNPYTSIDVYAGDTLQFYDVGYNSPTTYNWEINAGNGSIYPYTQYTNDPLSFTYLNPVEGNHSVKLTTSNEAGSASVTAQHFIRVLDTTTPASVTGVTNQTGSTTIVWNWTNPTDADFSHVMVWRNGVYHADFIENVTGNGTTWTGLSPSSVYTISLKTVDRNENVNATYANVSATTTGTSWVHTIPGATTWTCPAGVTNVTVRLVAGGGSGKGGSNVVTCSGTGCTYYSGSGGSAGEMQVISRMDVVPGQVYNLYIGAGGATAPYNTASNGGTDTSAFSYNVRGGNGGIALGGSINGTSGIDGYGTARFAINGTDGSVGGATKYGGISGLGYGASGGGGGSDEARASSGGAGANGTIIITTYGYQFGNIPEFSASPTTSSPGTLVRFTDLSTIVHSEGLSYNWSFGDGGYSSHPGAIQHVYAYLGSYDVSLVLNSTNGTVTETKEAYINIVLSDTGKINTLYPREVSFTLVDRYGRSIVDLPVTATMATSSVNGTNWLQTMFGLADTTIETTVLSDISDSNGQVVFPMVASGRYRMTFLDLSRGINEVKDIHPDQEDYIFILSTSATAIAANKDSYINVSLSTYPPREESPATVYLCANYTDTSLTSTNVTFYVRYANQTPIYSTSVVDTNTLNTQYPVQNVAGRAYVWGITSSSTRWGAGNKTMGITLPGTGQSGLANNLVKQGCNNWGCT